LEPGDVLLFCGSDLVSGGVRFFDDCLFDHVALVVQKEDEPGLGPLIADVVFKTQAIRNLSDYERKPLAILVRRHRMPGASAPVTAKAQTLMSELVDYDHEELLLMVCVSLTRFSPRLKQLGADERRPVAEAAAFVYGIHNLLTTVASKIANPIEGEKRICVTFVAESFAVGDHEPILNEDQYYGLHIPDRPMGGLLQWVASGKTFVEYLQAGFDPETEPDEDFNPRAVLLNLYGRYGFGASDLPMGPSDQLTANKENDLRFAVVTAAENVLKLLGWRPDEKYQEPEPQFLEASALYMLDQLLKRRSILTQQDITLTKSLVDIGQVDLSSVLWKTREPRPDRPAQGL
jgi:hypothetical protein